MAPARPTWRGSRSPMLDEQRWTLTMPSTREAAMAAFRAAYERWLKEQSKSLTGESGGPDLGAGADRGGSRPPSSGRRFPCIPIGPDVFKINQSRRCPISRPHVGPSTGSTFEHSDQAAYRSIERHQCRHCGCPVNFYTTLPAGRPSLLSDPTPQLPAGGISRPETQAAPMGLVLAMKRPSRSLHSASSSWCAGLRRWLAIQASGHPSAMANGSR